MRYIGNITFHSSHNYGSVLQAYALQNAVKSIIDCKYEIIDFSNKNQRDMYSIFYKNNSLKNICRNIRIILYKYKVVKSRYELFNKFINNNLQLSKNNYVTESELKNNNLKYDTLICGGDQIWNVSVSDFDNAYFLTFSDSAKKIAYAPSCGGENPFKDEKMKKLIIEYLKDFSHISMREEIGKEIFRKFTSKEINLVLDPTLLLEKKEWNNICSQRLIYEDYIFFYSIDYNNDVMKMVNIISKRLKLPVIILYTTSATYKTIFKGFKMCKYQGPSDFLSLIKYSKLVLTNSFHGTAFSIIYRKSFYVLRGTYDGKINNDNRMATILAKFHLYDREININIISHFKIKLDLNYSELEKYIEKERLKSIQFLKNSIYD
ncbi:polysaccharide pyruvyl transferase family protein [Clostridium saccharobutylicum]|uniref:Polysaccharide pyruvyl transferase n=2 Tax=Clostridium saccharobutylicum TaxID=169679 RepID=U5MT97_CLOSA|nr:polysaccharide pyruvyl transferase family protein [Clostridium saccharobutylicum]AGX43820.1 polysaccharide pyruvyl transferase [Clostridium saccharobutylicum DSM 13864]AQR91120.1 polysaccharide pyruvyl transferase [Clostridium saccharobutylicum]AQS01024.1 polysaccharide pyruvyl transferase [Clostridium saccharobutylicum]AQS10763.1 polysaccharide pyruvyl transferase [Clostridium saccharobutylicum]AQS15007.1 polysaccharide pyruvyl transferase [Clostridium saccharobutylicum]